MVQISQESCGLVTPSQLGLEHQFFSDEVAKMGGSGGNHVVNSNINAAKKQILFIASEFKAMDEAGLILQGLAPELTAA